MALGNRLLAILMTSVWCAFGVVPDGAGAEFLVQVRVRDHAALSSSEVTLGAIAEVSATGVAHFEKAKKLESVVIKASPDLGESEVVSADEILQAMSRAGIDMAQVGYEMPRTIRVTRPGVSMPLSSLSILLQEALAKSQDNAEIENILTRPAPVVFPTLGRSEAHLIERLVGNRAKFLLRVESNDGEVLEREVLATIREYSEVVVATRRLERGETLQDADLSLTKIDVRKARGAYGGDPAQLVGHRVTQPVGAGEPVPALGTKPPAIVRKGGKVTLRYRSGLLEATVSGVALADGAQGDVVRIRNESSNRVVEGRVAGEDLVEVAP